MCELPGVLDADLLPIRDKVMSGEWLNEADGVVLCSTRDIHGVGRLANYACEQLHGDVVFYNRNRHINYTNVCALSCKFCSFYRKRGEEGAYEMNVDEVVAVAKAAHDSGATEVHIVGGLHPWLKFEYYTHMLAAIRRECPALHIKAFTAIEIVHLSRVARMSVRDVLTALREAGLGSLPGGGAEIFDDRVHDEIFKGKVREDKWFDVHRTAHELGIFTNATMLYGHVETPAERVRHLIKLRELQREAIGHRPQAVDNSLMHTAPANADSLQPTAHSDLRPTASGLTPSPAACFNCLIPLSFIPDQSELGHLPGPTGLTDLRTLALARLMVPNVRNVKAFWIMQTLHLSQLSLHWGVNDLDGTVVWYDITKREGDVGTTHQQMHVSDIQRTIQQAGRTPVERDTLYRPIHRAPALHDAVTV
jgi:aminodeoxyfutalosine synthase